MAKTTKSPKKASVKPKAPTEHNPLKTFINTENNKIAQSKRRTG